MSSIRTAPCALARTRSAGSSELHLLASSTPQARQWPAPRAFAVPVDELLRYFPRMSRLLPLNW